MLPAGTEIWAGPGSLGSCESMKSATFVPAEDPFSPLDGVEQPQVLAGQDAPGAEGVWTGGGLAQEFTVPV